MKISQNKNIIFLLLVLNCIVVIGLNYVVGRDLVYPDYDMSENFVKLKSNGINSGKKNDFDFLLEYDDIKVISETNRNGLIGLYNPTMDYYYNSSNFNELGGLRYFSMEDYKDKVKVGIIIRDIVSGEFGVDDLIQLKKAKLKNLVYGIPEVEDFELINVFDPNSDIYKERIQAIVNLFALSSDSFDTIYIDSENTENLRVIKDKIKSFGYDEVGFNNRKPLLNSILNSLNNKYSKFIFQGVISTYLIFCYVFVVYLSKYNKYFRICLECGATFKEVLKNFIKQVCYFNLIAGFLSTFIMNVYLNYMSKNYLSFTELLGVSIFITITSMILTWVKFSFALKKTKGLMRWCYDYR